MRGFKFRDADINRYKMDRERGEPWRIYFNPVALSALCCLRRITRQHTARINYRLQGAQQRHRESYRGPRYWIYRSSLFPPVERNIYTGAGANLSRKRRFIGYARSDIRERFLFSPAFILHPLTRVSGARYQQSDSRLRPSMISTRSRTKKGIRESETRSDTKRSYTRRQYDQIPCLCA